MRKIKMIKRLVLVFLAAFLLFGATQAMALNIDVALVVGIDSASNTVDLEGEDLCMAAIDQLITKGFNFQSSTPIGKRGGPDVTAYLFLKPFPSDVVTLYCAADINVGKGPGGLF